MTTGSRYYMRSPNWDDPRLQRAVYVAAEIHDGELVVKVGEDRFVATPLADFKRWLDGESSVGEGR